jgi:hypothetical protein
MHDSDTLRQIEKYFDQNKDWEKKFFEKFGNLRITAKHNGTLYNVFVDTDAFHSDLEDEYKYRYNRKCYIFGTGEHMPAYFGYDFDQ